MDAHVTRRDALLGFGGTGILLSSRSLAANSVDGLARIEHRHGGRLGVSAQDLSTGRQLNHRAHERFKLKSSFKGLLTAMVLRRVADGQEDLAADVRFGRADLMAASPVTTANVSKGSLTVGELCAATMATSDNTAANLLMRKLGGPPAVTAFLRAIGDPATRIDNYEGAAEQRAPLPADSTTPEAIGRTLDRILGGSVLPDPERSRWMAWMQSNEHGVSRLRAAFPAGWTSGDRTRTDDGICNDYAYALRPGQSPLLITAYYAAPHLSLPQQEAVLREVGYAVVDWQR